MADLVRVASLRAVEAQALAALPDGTLMSRAAMALADEAQAMLADARAPGDDGCDVLVAAGPGNNGADALLAALLLHARGWRIEAYGDAGRSALNDRLRQRCIDAGLPVRDLASAPQRVSPCSVAIDGLFGIGQSRPLAGVYARMALALNASACEVLAVDVPSGLDADTGAVIGDDAQACVRAARTLTFLADKPGLHTGAGTERAGRVRVCPLGWTSDAPADGELFGLSEAHRLLPRRAPNTHKGSFGSVLVAGGGEGMQGAAILAALGAQAAGAGKVFVSSPAGRLFVAEQAQWMTRAWSAPLEDIDAIAFGCGLGRDARNLTELQRLLALGKPMVIDADGLNLLADAGGAMNAGGAILTPHPLEAARLLGTTTAEVQRDRIGAALLAARRFNATVVLKGAGSIVAAADGRWSVIAAGAPTLATAGSGDVLSGVACALLGQGLSAWDAARLAAWAHGRGGELMQQRLPLGTGMAATELFETIRLALNGR